MAASFYLAMGAEATIQCRVGGVWEAKSLPSPRFSQQAYYLLLVCFRATWTTILSIQWLGFEFSEPVKRFLDCWGKIFSLIMDSGTGTLPTAFFINLISLLSHIRANRSSFQRLKKLTNRVTVIVQGSNCHKCKYNKVLTINKTISGSSK